MSVLPGKTFGHLRFVGARVYCPRVERRVKLSADHRYGDEFVCPGCGVKVPARSGQR